MNPISISTVEYRPQNEDEARKEVPSGGGVAFGTVADQRTAQLTPKGTGQWSTTEVPSSFAIANSDTAADASAAAASVAPLPIAPSFKTFVARSNARSAGGVIKSKRVFKVIIIGDAGVGKTCLSYRFCNGRFPGPTEATIGVDFRERSLLIDDELIRVQLWDTAGQERYRQSIVAHYYRNVNAVVFVYDVFDPKSFRSLPAWIDECRKHALTASDDTPHILIGNKCDLHKKGANDATAAERTTAQRVKTDQAQVFADENDMALFETSALADSEADHVESIFLTLVHKLRQSKPMHVQSTEERSRREQQQQKILLKADEAAKLATDGDGGGMCC
ncbi:hypothetical protein niasHS_007166 [Heterodera schachtii]|uniref:Uncharacterized protein n=1 Tax=Heterodera schachtii TaxID=97005 RepID=A0ABD2JLQ4_HETSC